MSTLSTGASDIERQRKLLQTVLTEPGDKLAYTIRAASQTSGLSRSLLYLAIGEGRLRARKCRGRTVILHEDLQHFLASLPAIKAAAQCKTPPI
jgi:hypothetical protein